MGESRKSRGGAAKTAAETAKPWGRAKKVEVVRLKPQAKRQNHGGERKNRKQNVITLGKSHRSQGGAAKTAAETAKPWGKIWGERKKSRGCGENRKRNGKHLEPRTQNGQTIGQWLKP